MELLSKTEQKYALFFEFNEVSFCGEQQKKVYIIMCTS